MIFVDVNFQNNGFADKKIKVMISPEDHFLKPCLDTSDYQAQGRLAGRNYVQTNNKNQFTLKKDQSGTLLLCGMSQKPIVPTSLILRLATDEETFLEKEFHIAPRFQASSYQGILNVSRDEQAVLLPLDLSYQHKTGVKAYTYKCSDGQIQNKTLSLDNLRENKEIFVYQYKDSDDLQQVFRYRINLLEKENLPPKSVLGRKIVFKCQPSLFLRQDCFCDGEILVLAKQQKQICIANKTISVLGLRQAVDKVLKFQSQLGSRFTASVCVRTPFK